MKFTIDRRYWHRGELDSLLLDPDKKYKNMCCLGQIGEQCGIPRDELGGIAAPFNLTVNWYKLFSEYFDPDVYIWERSVYSDKQGSKYYGLKYYIIYAMMETNDDPDIDDARREMMLKDMAQYFYGHEVEFIN